MKCIVQLVRGNCKCCGPRVDKPRELRMRKVCSWCQLVVDEGEPGAQTTHTICEACKERFEAGQK